MPNIYIHISKSSSQKMDCLLILTSQSDPTANQHHSCHIRHQKWPAAGLAWQYWQSSPNKLFWRRRRTVRSGHEAHGSEKPLLFGEQKTECMMGTMHKLHPK